ncbi:MAG TPA: rhamnulokinase family protein, partial [Bacteroidota bacterium]|nr:rhamnulokinase family protein [Bacteroidota bacterium]
AKGTLLSMPVAYRDPYTDGIMDEIFRIIPRETLYARTGIQFMQLNSLFQLYALKKLSPELVSQASALLFMPDLINHMLTGIAVNEYTIASTSQLLDASGRHWDWETIDVLGFPEDIFQLIVHPSATIGTLRTSIADETGADPLTRVLTVTSHDTASAVAAVPSLSQNFAYISSGTWSLMGIEARQPVITTETLERNYTNEGGADNSYRVLKNITGMWLLEECRRVWNCTGPGSYDELIEAALEAEPFRTLIDPDDPAFSHPDDMPEAIRSAARRTHQPVPETAGAVTRAIFESLVLKYRYVLDELRIISPHPIDVLHVIGGGSRNALLCQWTADACALPVVAGPAEATAIGNIMMQARASGAFDTLGTMRRIILNSFIPETYAPRNTSHWNDAYDRFITITRTEAL